MTTDFTVFSGTAHRQLAEGVARLAGVALGDAVCERFPDGEITVRLNEPVRHRHVFVLQPTAPPVNDRLVELLAFADACRRASAAHVSAIVPYFGYARADKRHGRREPITASMVAKLLQAVGIDHLVTLDLHSAQIEGFFQIPVDSLTAVPTLADAVRPHLPEGAVIVSPDVGRVAMATRYAERLRAPVAVMHKVRESGTRTSVTHVVGDIRDRPCVLIDDMIATAGTLVESMAALRAAGARPEFQVVATHGLMLPGARERLAGELVTDIFVTDSVPQEHVDWPELRVVSVAPTLAQAIHRVLADGSMSDLFS